MFTLIRHELRSYTLFHDLYSNRWLKFRVNIHIMVAPKNAKSPLKDENRIHAVWNFRETDSNWNWEGTVWECVRVRITLRHHQLINRFCETSSVAYPCNNYQGRHIRSRDSIFDSLHRLRYLYKGRKRRSEYVHGTLNLRYFNVTISLMRTES